MNTFRFLVVCTLLWSLTVGTSSHDSTPVRRASDVRTWTMMASTADTKYAYIAPIAALSWYLQGSNVIVFLIEVADEWETDPRYNAIRLRLEMMDGVYPVRIPVHRQFEAVLISQESRPSGHALSRKILFANSPPPSSSPKPSS
eukprot:TRINITY_DN9784_c0_g1_i1.p1 TRINITY_DN9784_c0_g1~~TRINITY_DN9784_c0_g1_i1.p1  ORF type:complete len:144 (+),score=6.25 TRINITY_DN9784_c0_g1_i1:244-675(+)